MQTAMDEVDRVYLKEVLKSAGCDPTVARSTDVKVKDDIVSIEEILVCAIHWIQLVHQFDIQLDIIIMCQALTTALCLHIPVMVSSVKIFFYRNQLNHWAKETQPWIVMSSLTSSK